MRLYEFDDIESTKAKFMIVADALKNKLKKNELDTWSVDHLIDYLGKNDIPVDRADIIKLMKVEPLKDLISNIQGNRVVWKGKEPKPVNISQPDQKNKDTNVVKSMAKKAMNKS
jgi:hypothetical protein